MENWNQDFHGISISYSERLVRIKSDKALRMFLDLPFNGSLLLARHIVDNYVKLFHKPLLIQVHSLAIEIIAHVYIDNLTGELSKLSSHISKEILRPVIGVLNSIHKHTEIIDCGELPIDNNRYIWDSLEPFHKVIYGIVGTSF